MKVKEPFYSNLSSSKTTCAAETYAMIRCPHCDSPDRKRDPLMTAGHRAASAEANQTTARRGGANSCPRGGHMHPVKLSISRITASLMAAGAALLCANAVHAQTKYPDHPIRLIVPFPPGGQTDIVSRQIGARITPILGEQIVVDNRSGAAGSI